MTPQEQQMLEDLARRVNGTQLTDKDPEAQQFLTQNLARNPDAVYILAQTVLVQQYALDQAQKQLDGLRQQAQSSAPPPQPKHTSFLGSLLGMGGDDNQQPSQQQPQYAPVQSAPPPQQYGSPYGSPQYAQPAYGQAPAAGGGFLRNAMQTAAGVAAGAIAFQGIENLMGGFEHHAGYGGSPGFSDGGAPREEVINNYYGDDDGDRRGYESRDIEDRREDSFGNRLADADSGNQDGGSYDSDDRGSNGDDSDSGNDSGDNYDPGGTDDSF